MRADHIKLIFSVDCCHLMSPSPPLHPPTHPPTYLPTYLLLLPKAVRVSGEGGKEKGKKGGKVEIGTELLWSRLCWASMCCDALLFISQLFEQPSAMLPALP